MLLATSDRIKEIDSFAVTKLGIPIKELIGRSGKAVAAAVRRYLNAGADIVIFAGKGNNGADGYAAAVELFTDYNVHVYDVFGQGQKSEGGRYYLDFFRSVGGSISPLEVNDVLIDKVNKADCIVDAIFGTGFSGEIPLFLRKLAEVINAASSPVKIAVDVPLGVNSDNGNVSDGAACAMTATVSLCLPKPGLVSYPGKKYAGNVINDNIGLQISDITNEFSFGYRLIDSELAAEMLPEREANSNKGSFGKLLLITGSSEYPGAGALTLEAALRGGAGVTTYYSEQSIFASVIARYPEAIYKARPSFESFGASDVSAALDLSEKHSVTLLGSGCAKSSALYLLMKKLLLTDGAPIVLDADAINVMSDARDESLEILKRSTRTVILTPHPLEFARLVGLTVEEVQANRLSSALEFAKEHGCIIVLKGAATIVTDGEEVYVNSSGSSALAKAGSGDVLAGFLASVVAWTREPLRAAAFSVYVHGAAADRLAKEFSEIGVTPSDLPKEMASITADLLK